MKNFEDTSSTIDIFRTSKSMRNRYKKSNVTKQNNTIEASVLGSYLFQFENEMKFKEPILFSLKEIGSVIYKANEFYSILYFVIIKE